MESVPADANPDPRPALPADAAVLAELARLALPLSGSESGFIEEIERQATGSAAVWLIPGGCGGVVVRLAADEAELLWLAVHPASRRRGLARRLLETAIEWVDARAASLFLEVRESNQAALALYSAAGFVVAGRRERYYRDGEDALLLRRPASNLNTSAAPASQPRGEFR